MNRLVLASHGSLARGMKTAVKMIYGKDDMITDYNLDDYDEPTDIYNELLALIKEGMDDKYIIVTDIKGGSVFNKLLAMCAYRNVYLISVMSLPLVLDLCTKIENIQDIKKCLEKSVTESSSTIEIFDSEILSVLLSEKG